MIVPLYLPELYLYRDDTDRYVFRFHKARFDPIRDEEWEVRDGLRKGIRFGLKPWAWLKTPPLWRYMFPPCLAPIDVAFIPSWTADRRLHRAECLAVPWTADDVFAAVMSLDPTLKVVEAPR